MNDVLLTVSGIVDPDVEGQIARGERPLADYVAMARTFDADLLDYAAARRRAGWMGKLLEKIGGANLMLAWVCFKLRKRYRVIFTDGEQVGLPLAFFLKFA
ncbi:MAG: glycosyl transferase family 1, partial [Chloroflexi bacterium]|nr:glycosyl transferase family 1 [Chloroflexota bacterium]